MDFISLVKSKYVELTNSHQKIAKYVLDNFDEAIFDTARQLGKKNSVSETTIIRFSHALGFDSFADMNKAMRKAVMGKSEIVNQNGNSSDQLSRFSISEHEEYFHTQKEQGNPAFQHIDFAEFKKICNLIMSARKVLIIGYMDSFGIASELLHVLEKIRNRVYFYRLMYNEQDILYQMDEDSLVIAVSFPPHYKFTFDHTVTAKEGGCNVLTITDSVITPFTEFTDYSLLFNINRNSEIDLLNVSPVMNFIYFMVNYLYAQYKEDVERYRNSIERRVEKYIE